MARAIHHRKQRGKQQARAHQQVIFLHPQQHKHRAIRQTQQAHHQINPLPIRQHKLQIPPQQADARQRAQHISRHKADMLRKRQQQQIKHRQCRANQQILHRMNAPILQHLAQKERAKHHNHQHHAIFHAADNHLIIQRTQQRARMIIISLHRQAVNKHQHNRKHHAQAQNAP